jgi:hypothetical protein
LRPRDAFTDESGVNLTGRAQALEENGSRKLNRALRFAVGPLGNDATGLAKRPSTKARSCSSGADILFIGIRHGRSKRHPLDYAATLDFEACIHSQRLRRNGEKPILKLMFGTPIRAAERWRGLRFTEFELRQIAAVRKELDAEYEAKLTPSGRSSHPRCSSKSAP